jgi:hypothetical protein
MLVCRRLVGKHVLGSRLPIRLRQRRVYSTRSLYVFNGLDWNHLLRTCVLFGLRPRYLLSSKHMHM